MWYDYRKWKLSGWYVMILESENYLVGLIWSFDTWVAVENPLLLSLLCPSKQMLFEGILDSLVKPPAAPISLAAMGAPRIADTFGAMNAILDSTYLGDNWEFRGLLHNLSCNQSLSAWSWPFWVLRICYSLKYFHFAFVKFHGNIAGIGNSDIY